MSAYTRANGTSYGEPHSIWHGAVKGAIFGGILALVPRPMRNWMLTMIVLTFAICYTIKDAPDYEPFGPNANTLVEFDEIQRQQQAFFGTGYHFPWYCIALIVAFVVWGTYGLARAWYLSRQLQAIGDTPLQHLRERMSGRVLIAVDNTRRPPQSPTGPSRRPSAPPPAPSSPTGSNLPAVWVPTYSGPAKPLRRIETSLGGTVIHDHRGVDPEEL